jgi:hypothetical protein
MDSRRGHSWSIAVALGVASGGGCCGEHVVASSTPVAAGLVAGDGRFVAAWHDERGAPATVASVAIDGAIGTPVELTLEQPRSGSVGTRTSLWLESDGTTDTPATARAALVRDGQATALELDGRVRAATTVFDGTAHQIVWIDDAGRVFVREVREDHTYLPDVMLAIPPEWGLVAHAVEAASDRGGGLFVQVTGSGQEAVLMGFLVAPRTGAFVRAWVWRGGGAERSPPPVWYRGAYRALGHTPEGPLLSSVTADGQLEQHALAPGIDGLLASDGPLLGLEQQQQGVQLVAFDEALVGYQPTGLTISGDRAPVTAVGVGGVIAAWDQTVTTEDATGELSVVGHTGGGAAWRLLVARDGAARRIRNSCGNWATREAPVPST